MDAFPRTTVGGLSVSRMIIGTNWFAGWSHTGPSQDQLIKESVPDRKTMAGIIEVFVKAGVDTIMGPMTEHSAILDGIREAEQLTGKRLIKVDTPFLNMGDSPADRDAAERLLDQVQANGVDICMPHHQMVEQFLDRRARKIHRLGDYTKMIHHAKKPVMTIKPMAAGRLTPLVGLNFVWNTIRDCDMVTVGTMTRREAAEVIEYSLAALERRLPEIGGRTSPGGGKGTVLDKH